MASGADSVKICKVNGCSETHYARGLCRSHYMQQWRAGEISNPKVIMTTTVTAGVTRDLAARLDKEAARIGMNRSATIRLLLTAALDLLDGRSDQ